MFINKSTILNVTPPDSIDSAAGQAWLGKMAGATLGPSQNDNGGVNARALTMHTNAIDTVAKSGLTGRAADTAIIQEILRQTGDAIDAYNNKYIEAVEAQKRKIAAQTSFPADALKDAKAGGFVILQPANDGPTRAIMPTAPQIKAA